MAEEKNITEKAVVYLFGGEVLYGRVISPALTVKLGLLNKCVICSSDIVSVSKKTFGISRVKATIKQVDGSIIKGKLKGIIEMELDTGETAEIPANKIFAIKALKPKRR